MKITRNGQEIELTEWELREAYQEVKHKIDVYFAEVNLTFDCPREYYGALPEEEMKAINEDIANKMRTLVDEKKIHEEEAIREVVDAYIARKINEERGRRISKGKRKEVK